MISFLSGSNTENFFKKQVAQRARLPPPSPVPAPTRPPSTAGAAPPGQGQHRGRLVCQKLAFVITDKSYTEQAPRDNHTVGHQAVHLGGERLHQHHPLPVANNGTTGLVPHRSLCALSRRSSQASVTPGVASWCSTQHRSRTAPETCVPDTHARHHLQE